MTESPENSVPPPRSVWVGVAAVILAWPLGVLVGEILSVGQDGPGQAVAGAIGGALVLLTWLVAVVFLYFKCRGRFAFFETRIRALIMASVFVLPVATAISSANHQDYSLRVTNESGAVVDNVELLIDGRSYSFGVVGDRKYAVRRYVTQSPRGVAALQWTDASGQQHVETFDLSSEIPRRYNNGMLGFTISTDNTASYGFFIMKNY